MKLISARQAWREALHESRDSVLAAASERAKLGKKGRVVGETMSSMRDSNGRCAHMLAAGLVQSAIGTLSKPLQHFGHALYSPVANGQDINVAHALVWLTVSCNLDGYPARRREVAYWMALAAIKSHQAAVTGREAWGPGRVSEFVLSWYGVKVDTSHWARDWVAIWSTIADVVDSLDAKALRPVAAVIVRMSERVGDDVCRWGIHDREHVAEDRSARYLLRRESSVLALRERLSLMDEQQLRRWISRMRVYGDAYRAEWGNDVVENPGRHLIYLDRVTEYWNQRQRAGDVAKRVA